MGSEWAKDFIEILTKKQQHRLLEERQKKEQALQVWGMMQGLGCRDL